MPVNTASIDAVSQALVDLLNANKVALGVVDVFYGDQVLIPHTPSLAVDTGTRRRYLNDTGMAGENEFTLYVIVYHGKMQDNQITKKESIQASERVEALLHQNKQLGGLVAAGWVSEVDSGYAIRGGELWRVTRLTWFARSKTLI